MNREPTPHSFDSAEDIAAGIYQGNPLAEIALADRFRPGLIIAMQLRCQDKSQAEDIVHDAFVVVIERLREEVLKDPSKLASFIHQTAKNLWIGESRKAGRRNTYSDPDAIDQAIGEEADAQTNRIAQAALQKTVRAAIDELASDRDREILYQVYVLGADKPEVCQELALSERHYDRVIYRARQRIRPVLERFPELAQEL